jgi:hypothetical protein
MKTARLGKNCISQKLPKVAQTAKFHPIWSHWAALPCSLRIPDDDVGIRSGSDHSLLRVKVENLCSGRANDNFVKLYSNVINGATTISLMTVSIMTVSIMTLSTMTISIMKVNIMKVSVMKVSIMRVSIMTVSIMTVSIMTVSVMTVSIMTVRIMTVSKMTVSKMTVSIMTVSITSSDQLLFMLKLYFSFSQSNLS